MTTTLTHKIRLDPTCRQRRYFAKACGTARFTWNWALDRWKKAFKNGEKPNAFELKKELNALKRAEFPWMYEVTKYASQQPFIHLRRAFTSFFAKRARHPQFKKKGVRDSFYIGGDQVVVRDRRIKIPNLGWVHLREDLRFSGKIVSATISRTADYWFASVHVETEEKPPACESQAVVGVDLGVSHLATLSNGEQFEGPRPLKRLQKRLKRAQKRLSRMNKGSANRAKMKNRIARMHYRIRCTRQDALHKLTTYLISNFKGIVIEDLDVSGMLQTKGLAASIADLGFFEFRRQMEYKSILRNAYLHIADRWFASSKICSACGAKKQTLALSTRTYKCLCGLKMNRDLNAAMNLEKLLNTVSFTGINACGQSGSASSS